MLSIPSKTVKSFTHICKVFLAFFFLECRKLSLITLDDIFSLHILSYCRLMTVLS